jgi:hypothetical protein
LLAAAAGFEGDAMQRTKWEYRTLKIPTEFHFLSGTDFDEQNLDQVLNEYGQSGWELTSMMDIEKVKGGSKFVLVVMKRPCPDTHHPPQQ